MMEDKSFSAQTRSERRSGSLKALLSGAGAGLAVDLSLFPLDTLKTRLQSEAGFRASGGLSRLYAGLPSVVIGSAPGAALFFLTYESVKRRLPATHASHAAAASLGELVACLVRVPTELLKQRAQAFPRRSQWYVVQRTWAAEGASGLYRGYWSTIVREVPFSFIQFPIWEGLKAHVASRRGVAKPSAFEGAACGSLAGMLAASVTTPLDVAKTRIMLAQQDSIHSQGKVYPVLRDVYQSEGARGLYAGLVPRTMWMGLGGFVFFGAYETLRRGLDAWYQGSGLDTGLRGYFRSRVDTMLQTIVHGGKSEEDMRVPYEDKIAAAEAKLLDIKERAELDRKIDQLPQQGRK